MQLEPAVKPHAGFVGVHSPVLNSGHVVFLQSVAGASIAAPVIACSVAPFLQNGPHQGQSRKDRGNGKTDAHEQIERRQPAVSTLQERDDVERKGGEGREAAEAPGNQEDPQLLWCICPHGEDTGHQADQESADEVDGQCSEGEGGARLRAAANPTR